MAVRSPWSEQFLFARAPNSGIEDLAEMKTAGFTAIFVNTRDFPENRWMIIRQRAERNGMICGPWGRTAKGPNDLTWAPEVMEAIIDTADRWQQPFVLNPEKEIDFSDDDITTVIRQAIGDRNGAVSTLARPMSAVNWHPLADIPVLAQLFVESGQFDPDNVKEEWWAAGIRCLLGTLGAYGGRRPDDYPRVAPYSIYTADDIGAGRFRLWVPRSFGYQACKEVIPVPPKPPLSEKKFPNTAPRYGPSHPKGPTRNSPTVKGIKRGMIRMGYLNQQLGTETDDYGMALEDAMQEWQRDASIVPASGQYGRASWNALRSAVVPVGRPNAGAYAMDARALAYIREDALLRCYVHPAGVDSDICQHLHPTAGLLGNWAKDFCADGGTKVLAVERAVIRKLSGHDPALGVIDNDAGIGGWSIHYETAEGYRYYSTHYQTRTVFVGQQVEVGDVLGTVWHWPGDPGRSHTHLGVTSPLGVADAKKRITEIGNAARIAA